MKKISILAFLAVVLLQGLMAQTNCYWVLLTDKKGSTFDPYTYFDAKAIERYQQCGADLYDISNYPVVAAYESRVAALATEDLGTSRWLNAVAVMATPEQAMEIGSLACVREVKMVGGEWQLAQVPVAEADEDNGPTVPGGGMFDQLIRMGGQTFKDHGYNGKGIRIAVFDSGFPHVDTHDAFRHLRVNKQIVKTWNFPDKKENVYLAGSHGTMTLSCIAGLLNDSQLGLATGAEFLLARTEINTEPFKEEVWWMQAMEWADKNGARIISSSLGYGKERHYTYEMDGRSYVAKAANMAARKGMLVCNSAGNEGDDRRWKTIITPSDADSVLCVAGIEDELTSYRHISFSSYGPGADGRRKPNVAAFGHAVVADHSKHSALTTAYGTSFSCPLVSGFVACAWQTRPELTAMQMMQEIEKSADLYPYYDYALGYGVPQASYFVEGKKAVEPTFRIENRDFYVAVIPLRKHESKAVGRRFAENDSSVAPNIVDIKPTFFFKSEDRKGNIEKFYSVEFDKIDPSTIIVFRKGAIYRNTLVVSYEGYTESFRLSDAEIKKVMENGRQEEFSYAVADTNLYILANYEETMDRSPEDNKVKENAWGFDVAINMGLSLLPQLNPGFTPMSYNVGGDIRFTKPLAKRYALGWGLVVRTDGYLFDNTLVNDVDNLLGITSSCESKSLSQVEYDVEFFQRVIIMPGGALTHHGLHWDLGVWAGVRGLNQYITTSKSVTNADILTSVYSYVHYAGFSRFVFGATTRLTWDWIGLYANYRLSDLLLKSTDLKLPALSVGILLEL